MKRFFKIFLGLTLATTLIFGVSVMSACGQQTTRTRNVNYTENEDDPATTVNTILPN
jgi:hypothetical protein